MALQKELQLFIPQACARPPKPAAARPREIRTSGHQDETVFTQKSSIDGLQLICPKTVQTKLSVKYIHHFFRMGKFHTLETL